MAGLDLRVLRAEAPKTDHPSVEMRLFRGGLAMRRATAITFGMSLIATGVQANELWSCHIISKAAKQPMLMTFEVKGNELIQTWTTGIKSNYDIAQNNVYGLVGLSSISAIEHDQTEPTVGASAVVIQKSKKEVWVTTAIAGQQAVVNDLSHGTCIRSP